MTKVDTDRNEFKPNKETHFKPILATHVIDQLMGEGLDVDAANRVNTSAKKPRLTLSPFVRKFDYGHNQDGYWSYDTMILQFEDCVDVLRCLFRDEFEYIFYMDHSSCHGKLRSDGLNVRLMNKRYGGNQPKMRNSKICVTQQLLLARELSV